MIPRFKKFKEIPNPYLKKEEFLEEHNKISPESLKATTSLLSRFRIEKASLFRTEDWPIDKIRRPFLIWLTSLSLEKDR